MTRDQILDALMRETVSRIELSRKYNEASKTFYAACLINDGAKCEQIRSELHSLLDAILDSSGVSLCLSRQLDEIS